MADSAQRQPSGDWDSEVQALSEETQALEFQSCGLLENVSFSPDGRLLAGFINPACLIKGRPWTLP